MRATGVHSWMSSVAESVRRIVASKAFLLADLGLVLVLAIFWLESERSNPPLFFLIIAALILAYVELYRRESRWVGELSDVNSDLTKALAQSDTLAEISKEFSAEIEVEVLYDLVACRARQLLGADYASVAVSDDTTGETVWVAGVGFQSDAFSSLRRETGAGLVGKAMSSGEPVIVEDFGTNPDFPTDAYPLHNKESMVAALVMPVARGSRSLGALTVGFRMGHSFTEEEVDLLEALAGQAGIAMENASLYAEEKRRVGELEAVLDHMSEGVIVTNPSGRVLRCNEAARLLLGEIHPGTVLSEPEWKQGLELLDSSGDSLPMGNWPLLYAALGEQFVGREVIVRREDSRLRYISIDGRPVLSRKGEVVLGVTVIHDITGVREMDKLKDEFLSLAAHELRTPLTSIKGYAQMLMSKGDNLGDFSRRALVVMDQQADRINRMVEQFLLVEEIRSGRIALRFERVDLSELVSSSCEQFSRPSPSRRVLCKLSGEAWVNADPRGLMIVLSNLLENALKFSPDSSPVEVSLAALDGIAQVRVRDNGVGIPKDKQEHLFDRFYQVQPGTQKGVGLGLYISQELVASHGGRMWLESKEGEGSSFFFAIPLAEARPMAVHE